ncbi:MAG TPA: hypothetical protein VE987_05240 [Polyangiaceae bacterium]|nr:hypothetical protein [Polyangiaceae bacterium]
MGVLETVARIVQLGGAPERAGRVAQLRARFEAATGAFAPDDGWFEARSRAFWCDAVTRGAFGREVESELGADERAWLVPLERAHRGLFRAQDGLLVDVWSGAELMLNTIEEESQAELDAAAGQLFDARIVASDAPLVVALLPGAVFHPPDATAAIGPVLAEARARGLRTHEALDALLRMERTLRSLARVKAAYAYRPDALLPHTRAPAPPMRRMAKGPT